MYLGAWLYTVSPGVLLAVFLKEFDKDNRSVCCDEYSVTWCIFWGVHCKIYAVSMEVQSSVNNAGVAVSSILLYSFILIDRKRVFLFLFKNLFLKSSMCIHE